MTNDLRIADAPLLVDVSGEEKLPTGGYGNYSTTINQIADFTQLKWKLATEGYVGNEISIVTNKLNNHTQDKTNPHGVTKEQVGLGEVDNTADLDKPVSAYQRTAIDEKIDKSSIVDNLTTNESTKVLSAKQGKVLQDSKVDKTYLDDVLDLKADKSYVSEIVLTANGNITNFEKEVDLLEYFPEQENFTAKALDTKKVWFWNGSMWKDTGLSELDLAKDYIDSFDLLKINKGKDYPLKKTVRNNETSQEAITWNDFLLDVRVNNADPSKYYQIAYQQNGATALNTTGFGWIIYEFDKSTFSTNAVATTVVNITDTQEQIIPNGTVQTVTIKSTVRSQLSFTITCDTSSLPLNNTPINSITQGNPAWSFIIDPNCYFNEDTTILSSNNAPRSWLYNRGDFYPFIQANFKGVTSAKNTTVLDLFKDIKVENAEDGYVYSFGYYTNGSTAINSAYTERWIIFKRLESNYSETTATETQIVALAIPQQTLPKTGNIESITLQSSGLEKFHVTVDTSKLPTYGTFVKVSQVSDAGYSWYISKSNYIYGAVRNANAYFEFDSTSKVFKYRYVAQGIAYEVTFGTNGANRLPNFKEIKKATGTNLVSNNFSTVQSFTTDWLPPLVFYAVNNSDDANINSFTGGNHASNGDATGDPTAENELFTIFVDGQALDMTKNVKCFCSSVDAKIVNKLMASNTKMSKRYALRQIFNLKFDGSAISVHCKLKALEDIKLRSDYALQMTTTGYTATQLMLESETAQRVTFNSSSTSGNRADYPNANAVILKGTGGILASWMDRSYGNAVSENCAPDQPLIRGGGGSNTKFYQCAFRSFGSDESTFPPLAMDATTEYKWRGGYVIQADNADNLFDSVLDLNGIKAVIDGNNYF